jgi:hypothetical protein
MYVDHKVGDVLPATRVVDFMPGKGLAALACSRMGIPYFGCFRNLAREIMEVHIQQIVEGFVSFRGCVRAFAWSGCLIESVDDPNHDLPFLPCVGRDFLNRRGIEVQPKLKQNEAKPK